MTPKAYLSYLQRKFYDSSTMWTYNPSDPESDEAITRIRRAKGVLGGADVGVSEADVDYLKKLANSPPWMRLDPLAESLHTKSIKLVSSKDAERLQKAAVGFLPTGIINACCVGGLQNGYVIALNYGLFYTFNLLSIALLAPDTTGELLQDALESVEPERIVTASIDCAIRPSRETYSVLERHYSYMTPELLGLGAAGGILMLQFILLHEAGHICNGDVDKGLALATVDFENRRIDYARTSLLREYAADRYALDAFLSQTEDSVSAWARFSQVETVLLFLTYIERAGKSRVSQTHPPAIARLRRLREMVKQKWGTDELGYTKTIGIRLDAMHKG